MPPGEQTTTTQSNPKPYKPARPLINTALNDAMRAYSKGIGGQSYTGSMVVPFSQQTSQAMGNITDTAKANLGGQGLSGQYQNVIDNGGFNSQQMDAVNNFRNLANSQYDMNANPGFANVLKQAQDAARNQVNMGASAAGRYGSAVQHGAVAREVGNLTDRMVSNDFNNWLGRRDAANSQLFNAGQQGQANLGTAFAGMQDPAKALMGVGSMNEDLYKRQLDDQMRLFNDAQNKPWEQMQRLMAMGNLTGGYAKNSSTSTAPGPNPFLSGLSQVSSGVGLLSGLGLF